MSLLHTHNNSFFLCSWFGLEEGAGDLAFFLFAKVPGTVILTPQKGERDISFKVVELLLFFT